MVARTLFSITALIAAVSAQGRVRAPSEIPLIAIRNETSMPISRLGSMCEQQNGFDFIDHDLKQVRGDVDSCCDACQDTSGCKAWSWNDWNGGTCFLKTDVDKIVPNPNVKSARVFPTIPLNACREEENYDYEDANLASVQAAKAQDCCDICRKHQGCRYYVWSNYEGGTCWLKATGEKKVAKLNVFSAAAYSTGPTVAPPDTPPPMLGESCEDENGFDFVGHDIKQVKGNVDSCCNACMSVDNCKAWTWSSWNGGTCFLKDAVDKIVANPDARSSRRFPTIRLNACNEVENTDYEDATIGHVKANEAHDCCKICRDYQGCRYYAWNNYENGTCWLKATGDKKVKKEGVFAAQAYATGPY